MPYIPIELNRHFAALESSYGAVPAFAAANAFHALKTDVELQQEYLERKDITGTRSFAGVAGSGRRNGQFQIEATWSRRATWGHSSKELAAERRKLLPAAK